MKRLFEISGNIKFSMVVPAETGEQALAYINDKISGEELVVAPWNANIFDVSDIGVVGVRNVPKSHKGDIDIILTGLAHHVVGGDA